MVLATTPNPYVDDYDKVPSPARVETIANGIIAGVPEDKLTEIIQSARTDDELSDLIEVASFVQEIDFLTEQLTVRCYVNLFLKFAFSFRSPPNK